MKKMRAPGAVILLVSLTAPAGAQRFDFGAEKPSTPVRRAAQEEQVAMIDLNAMSKLFNEALSPTNAHVAFAGNDKTHHSDYGSYELAKCIVEGIKENRLPIAKYLVDVPKFDPAHPGPFEKFDVPAKPAGPPVKPYGN